MTWLAGVLEDCGYFQLDVLDMQENECASSGIDVSSFTSAFQDSPADVYLFSPMTPNLPFALEIATVAKKVNPNAVTVFGGVVATPMRHQVAGDPSVDFVVHGRGERALPALLDSIVTGADPRTVGHLCYRLPDGNTVETDTSYPWLPLSEIPFPKVDLFSPDLGQDIRYLRQVYCLGCPYRCDFCTIPTIGRRPEYFAIPRVLAEIRAYRRQYGEHHNIYFGDETFTIRPERTKELCVALEREGGIFYDCQTRTDCLEDDSMLTAMKRGGCRWVEIGIESFDQDTQDQFKQRVSLQNLREVLRKMSDLGIPVCSFVVNGFPNQTVSDMRRSIELVAELIDTGLLHASYLFGLVPYPGSGLHANPEKVGMKIHHTDYRLYLEDMPPVYSTPYATPDEMYEAFLEGLVILGEAMGKPPVLGDWPTDGVSEFGRFWAASHV